MLRFVAMRRADPSVIPEALGSAAPDARVSLHDVEAMFLGAIERFGDNRLGLKLGRLMRFGEGGAFDYAVQSARTVRESLDVAARYCELLSDSLHIWQEPGRQVVIRLMDDVSWTAPSADFAMCAFYKLHLANLLPAASQPECWLPYPEPQDLGDHLHNFPGLTLRFAAPFFAFAFNEAYCDAPLPGADPVLHAFHCDRVRTILDGLRRRAPTSQRVRKAITGKLKSAQILAAEDVARALNMSHRTMARRLLLEGTSFQHELDAVRREIALSLVGNTGKSLTEVAFLLGFSHVESLHRAFRRWTNETPFVYRSRSAGSGA
jgi:AraC-like DNA-binding protein